MKIRRFFKLVSLILVLSISLPFLYFGSYFFYPDIFILKTRNPKKTSFMTYREREWKAKGRKITIIRNWVPFSQISPYLVKAVIISEDDKFWSHEGFDFEAIQTAIEKDLETRKFRFGGSTISQQLAKNLFLSPEKTLVRKLKEAILTWRIEKNLSKRRILELYLNTVEWGNGVFGIGAAARHYYDKSASELSALEAASLAAILPNPRKYSPTGQSRYVEKRTRIIYEIMVRRGIIIPDYDETEKPEQENKEDLPAT